MSQETFTLTFDETVESDTFDPALLAKHFTFYSASNLYTLTSGSVASPDGPVITVNISKADLDQLKLNTDLATEVNNTQIEIIPPPTIVSAGIRDMARNGIVQKRLTATRVIPDAVNPELVSFAVDLTTETLTLSFSEPVNASSLVVSAITLQSDRQSTHHHTLSPLSYTSSGNGLTLVIRLAQTDLNALKLNESLVVGQNTTYLSMTSTVVKDMNSNPAVAIRPENSLQATSFQNDTIRPRLLSYELDMNTARMVLHFSETVDTSTLDITGITLQSSSDLATASAFRLRQRNLLSSADGTSVHLRIGQADLDELTAREIALSARTAFVLISNSTIRDMNNRAVLERISSLDALQIAESNFTIDSTRPSLLAYHLDLDADSLTLTFDESVRAQTINTTGITFQNAQNSSSANESFTLTAASTAPTQNSPVITISLGESDLNKLKQLDFLATRSGNTFLVAEPFTAADMVALPLNAVKRDAALRAGNYTQDRVVPELRSFDFDADSGVLKFSFSETVRSSSIISTSISLQEKSSRSVGDQWFNLTAGSVLTADGPQQELLMTNDDLNKVKERTSLATAANNTYLAFTTSFVTDMNGNAVVEVLISRALLVQTYTADTTVARLVSSELNLDAATLLLNFSESVNVSSLQVTDITFLNNASGSTQSRRLTAGSSRSINGPSIVINLDKADVDEIKRLTSLATSDADTFLALESTTIIDMAGNALAPIAANDSVPITSYVRDTTAPFLVSFDLDMTRGEISMLFSETVNASSFKATSLVLRGAQTTTAPYYQLQDSGNSTSSDGLAITLTMTNRDQNEIKKRLALASGPSDTFLSFDADMIADNAGNAVVALSSNAAKGVQT